MVIGHQISYRPSYLKLGNNNNIPQTNQWTMTEDNIAGCKVDCFCFQKCEKENCGRSKGGPRYKLIGNLCYQSIKSRRYLEPCHIQQFLAKQYFQSILKLEKAKDNSSLNFWRNNKLEEIWFVYSLFDEK